MTKREASDVTGSNRSVKDYFQLHDLENAEGTLRGPKLS